MTQTLHLRESRRAQTGLIFSLHLRESIERVDILTASEGEQESTDRVDILTASEGEQESTDRVDILTASEGEQESTERVDILTAAEAEPLKESQVVVQSETPCTDSTVNATNLPLTHLFDEKHSLLSQDKLQNELDKIMQTIPAHFSELNCKHLQESTRGQSSSEQWFEQRQGRITASHFNEVLRCKTSQA